MKKIAVIIAAATLSLTACHYGKSEAQESLERNKNYKDNPIFEQGADVDPEYVKKNGTAPATEAPAATQDTTAAQTEAAAPAHN